MDKGGKKAG